MRRGRRALRGRLGYKGLVDFRGLRAWLARVGLREWPGLWVLPGLPGLLGLRGRWGPWVLPDLRGWCIAGLMRRELLWDWGCGELWGE